MVDWVTDHATFLQVLLNALMVVIWIVYLQVFLYSFRRQRRAEILISIGTGEGLSPRCMVSNLGLEPVYITEIIVTFRTERAAYEALVSGRSDPTEAERIHSPSIASQGPLASGSLMDLGSLKALLERASHEGRKLDSAAEVRAVEVLVIASTAASWSLVGASRKYRLRDDGERQVLRPTSVSAHQIRGPGSQRRLTRKMEAVWQKEHG